MDTTQFSEKVIQLLQKGEKLMAVKVYKEETGCDLMSAKYIIDEAESQMREDNRRKATGMKPGDEVMQLIKRGEKLMAVKVYKEQTGCDLILAKNYIDELYEVYGPKPEIHKSSSFKEWSKQQAVSHPTQKPKKSQPQPVPPSPTTIGDHYDKGEPQGCLGIILIFLVLVLISFVD